MAPNPRVFFDFTVADKPLGRVVFELYNDVVPKTAENFRALCTGEKGISPTSNVPLHYKSSIVHRIIEGFMIQGGDFTKRTGAGGESIYGGTFKDERLEGEGTQVDKKGLLVMANRGPDTNGSQWFITLAPAQHLTGKHVVFGRVIFGLEHIETIGQLPTDEKDRPFSPVVIAHCGELELRKAPPAKKARSPSVSSSISRSRSPSPIKRRSKSKRHSDSEEEEDGSDDSRERERRRRKKDKKKDKKDKKRDKGDSKKPREETEEELDARLEREEKERLEIARLEKLAEMKKELEAERLRIQAAGGVVYKGRGAMRYLDPESVSSRSSLPRNFDSRGPDVRPRGGRGGPPSGRNGDRWERGAPTSASAAARPRSDRDRLDKDMDRWQHDRGQGAAGRGQTGIQFRREERQKGRSKSPIRRSKSRSRSVGSPRMRSESPVLRGRTRSRSLAKSDHSDMVLDAED
ncbi:hypothetical protein CI109_107052 [Kwoniella shandongensis]|uniref:peptidylprolyl isomerase n=1 Tax=Kwoniella shandongensis TaxID=1734106 RepID=A0A5M6BT50_9TREE|nr:uncharacterized protein CI109_006461 [Kwoniella shandongensis]KAA5525192.1 hypothetical protein CI109_006461 [Kwoniella shandongensis]